MEFIALKVSDYRKRAINLHINCYQSFGDISGWASERQ